MRVAYPNASVQQYRKASIDSATPLQLVVMLYDGAIRFLNQARVAMQHHNLEKQHEYCLRAQDIVSELICCLDTERGGEVASSLFSLYSFVYDRIVQANIQDDLNYLDQAMRVLTELRESWSQLEQMSHGAKQGLANAS